MALTADQLYSFLDEDIGLDISNIKPDDLLFSTSIVDSFALVSLMTFIETEEGVRISPWDVNLENMDSIERILAFVEKLRS